MKRQLIMIAVSAVIFSGLFLTYTLTQRSRAQENAEPETVSDEARDDKIVLVDRPKSDIKQITFQNGEAEFTVIAREATEDNDVTWELSGDKSFRFSKTVIDSMVTPFFYLSPSSMLTESTDNPARYGFDKPARAQAEYTDGTRTQILVGSKTPGGDRYYIMMEGDPAVYLIIPAFGERFFNGYNEIINKDIPQIQLGALLYAYVRENGAAEMELEFDDEKSGAAELLENYGESIMKMLKPFTGREVYVSYFMNHLNESFQQYSLGDLVETDCPDMSKYGLDDPALEIILEDSENRLDLSVGDYAPAEDDTEDESVYVRLGGSNNVFKMSAGVFKSFRGIKPLKFIERFTVSPLPNISSADTITLESNEADRADEIKLGHTAVPPPQDGTGEIRPTVNGKEVDAERFRKFYQSLIGLSADVDINGYEITEEPLVTVTYVFNSGRETYTTKYFNYDANFYAVQINGDAVNFIVSKKSVRDMYSLLDALPAPQSDGA